MMAWKKYEELDPDNQDRSQDYYLGVADAARYALDSLDLAFRGHGGVEAMDPRVQAVRESLYRLWEDMAERRSLWFVDHVGAEYDPSAKAPNARERTGPEEGDGAKEKAME